VYVWFRDAWGNVTTSPATDTNVVDKTAPTMGSLFQAVPGPGRVELTWSAATDAASGVSSYKLVYAKSTTAPSCASGMTAYSGSATSYTHSNLTAGKYSSRMCALDSVGNISTGLTRTVTVP
jgi:hypothetical protein